jgi:predicted nucleic acid-binding protein
MTGRTRASRFVTDAMGLVLHLEQRRMSAAARAIFHAADAGGAEILIPGLVFAEIMYLSERRRISLTLSDVAGFLAAHPAYHELPLSLDVVRAAAEITDVPELHDRLIAGVARLFDLDLLTNDPVIHASALVRAIW